MTWLRRVWRKAMADGTNGVRRTGQREWLAQTEWLEPRLCLGGLAAPDLPDWSSGPPARPPEPFLDVAAEVEIVTAGSARPQRAGTEVLQEVEASGPRAWTSRAAFRPAPFAGSDPSDSPLVLVGAPGLSDSQHRSSAGEDEQVLVSVSSAGALDPARRSAGSGTAAAALADSSAV